MKRGEIWTVSGRGTYTGKPRPAVILQDDGFDATESITVCPFTTDTAEAPLIRLPVEPDGRNGLDALSRIMVDKIVTVLKRRIRERIGELDRGNVTRLDRAGGGVPWLGGFTGSHALTSDNDHARGEAVRSPPMPSTSGAAWRAPVVRAQSLLRGWREAVCVEIGHAQDRVELMTDNATGE